MRRLSNKHIILGAASALSILLVVIILGYQSVTNSNKSSDWVNHTLGAIAEIGNIENGIANLVTSQRGFVLTSQDRYINLYQKAKATLDSDIKSFEERTKDNEVQQGRLTLLKSDLVILKNTYDKNFESVKAGKVSEAVDRIKKGLSQDRLDHMQTLLHEMKLMEEDLLNKRIATQKNSGNLASSIVLAGSIVAFFMVLLAALLVLAEFNRRNKIQKDLDETSALQKAILDSAAFALIATDAKGNITLFNPAAEKLLGYSREEMIGKSPGQFHVQEEIEQMSRYLSSRFNAQVDPGFGTFSFRAEKGIVESDQWTYVRKDGTRLPVSLSMTAQKDESGTIIGFLGIAFDVSKQLEYEHALVDAKEQALAGTQAKSEFLANMSHEIRTPMNAIMGMAELLNETELNEEQRKYVDVFQRAGESLLNIINDILDLSKIEAGHFELDKIPFTISNMVDKATEIMALKAHQKQLELAVDLDPDLFDYYLGDPNRIRQILLNLIGNAIKFTKKGEVVLKINGGTKNYFGREVIIEITDTGIGMSKAQLEKLFERFNQADSSITKEYGGTGLGLNITKRLVELMNGSIQVESTEGSGTKFTVRIFLEEDFNHEDAAEEISLSGKKIIIIDDTKTNRLILKKIVERQGAITHEAENGENGLKMIHEAAKENTPYDLVLLDCRMPGIDGFKVAEQVQSTELKGPMILMLTSDNRPGDLAKSRSLGLKSYLVKPVLKNELLREIARALYDLQPKAVMEKKTVFKSHSDLNILLVDDNDENRLVIRSFLKSLPWKIEEAKNGKDALDLYSPGKYDVILMDMQMPVLDGYSATREIRKQELENKLSPTPIIALTAYALKEEVDKSLEAGCNGHQSKPVAKASLIKAVEDITKAIDIVVDKDLEDLIPDYLSNRDKEVDYLRELFLKGEFPQIQAIGHKLRGSAGSYGFSELSEIGKELEEKSKVSDSASINYALNQYKLYLKRIKVSFQ